MAKVSNYSLSKRRGYSRMPKRWGLGWGRGWWMYEGVKRRRG